jgi:hypothetical protein
VNRILEKIWHFLDGVVATGKSGVTSLQVVAGKSNQSTEDKVYSLHASYNPAKAWTVGGTVAKSNSDVRNDRNYWGTDVQYATGKANFVADYLKSDEDTNNDALVIGVSYAFDNKNTLSAYSHNTGSNSNIATDWDNGQKGAYYIYNHTFDKTTALNLLYKEIPKMLQLNQALTIILLSVLLFLINFKDYQMRKNTSC